jgi:chromosome segregation ATPase
MTATTDLFRKLCEELDELVRTVDEDLPKADDIHPAIAAVGAYAAEGQRLPKALAKLEAQKASASSGIPARDEAIRKAKHAVRVLEDKCRKLGEKLDRNRAALTESDLAERPAAPAVAFRGLKLPTRVEIIEQTHVELLAAEDELEKARAAFKQACAFRKGVTTRLKNLDEELGKATQAAADHAAGFEGIVKVLRKTITHLKNRQAKRDRKRADGCTCADGTPLAAVALVPAPPREPSDEDVRKMCEEAGLPIDGADDIAAARALFCR